MAVNNSNAHKPLPLRSHEFSPNIPNPGGCQNLTESQTFPFLGVKSSLPPRAPAYGLLRCNHSFIGLGHFGRLALNDVVDIVLDLPNINYTSPFIPRFCQCLFLGLVRAMSFVSGLRLCNRMRMCDKGSGAAVMNLWPSRASDSAPRVRCSKKPRNVMWSVLTASELGIL